MKEIVTYMSNIMQYGIYSVENNSVDEVYQTLEDAEERADILNVMKEGTYEVVKVVALQIERR